MSELPETRHSLLARLADARDAGAWGEFQRIYEAAIFRRARHQGLQEADAQEVVQEVLLAVHRGMVRWEQSGRAGSFRAWLAETVRRLTLEAIRRRQAVEVAGNGSAYREALERPAVAEPTDRNETLRWAFYCACAEVEQEVESATWRAFWWTAVEGKPAQDVARELGWTIGNVYSAKCRVLARIRRHAIAHREELT